MEKSKCYSMLIKTLEESIKKSQNIAYKKSIFTKSNNNNDDKIQKLFLYCCNKYYISLLEETGFNDESENKNNI